MATPNGIAVKAELIRRLKLEPALAGVQVVYALGRDVEREVVYGGKVEATVDRSTMRDASGFEDHDETATIHLHIRVLRPGGTDADAELRAAAIGAAIEALVDGDPGLSGAVPGLADLQVTATEYDTGYAEDDDLIGLGNLQLLATSYLQ